MPPEDWFQHKISKKIEKKQKHGKQTRQRRNGQASRCPWRDEGKKMKSKLQERSNKQAACEIQRMVRGTQKTGL